MFTAVLNFITPVIHILLPVALIPILMRFAVSPLILFFVKRKYLPGHLEELHLGWENPQDLKAVDAVIELTNRKLKQHFIFRFNLEKDFKELLLCVQRIKSTPDASTLSFHFSLKKLLYSLLLAFCDLYKEYSQAPLLRFAQNVRLVWFKRMWRLTDFYSRFTQLPVIRQLNTSRVLGRIIRIMLIPLLGPPVFLWYLLSSALSSLLYEGVFRFYYGVLMMKVGYYAIYLYGEKNSLVEKRIESIPKRKLLEIAKQIEELLVKGDWQKERSAFFEPALQKYQDLLEGHEIIADNAFRPSSPPAERLKQEKLGNQLMQSTTRALKRFKTAALVSLKKQNPLYKHNSSDFEFLMGLIRTMAKAFYPLKKQPLLHFRVIDAIESGYMGSVLILARVFATPGAATLLDGISLDFALQLQKLARNEELKSAASAIGHSYKYLSLFNRARKIFKIAKGLTGPYSLIFSIGTPLLFQQLQDLLREYLFQRAGRICLYEGETSVKKRKKDLKPLLW